MRQRARTMNSGREMESSGELKRPRSGELELSYGEIARNVEIRERERELNCVTSHAIFGREEHTYSPVSPAGAFRYELTWRAQAATRHSMTSGLGWSDAKR